MMLGKDKGLSPVSQAMLLPAPMSAVRYLLFAGSCHYSCQPSLQTSTNHFFIAAVTVAFYKCQSCLIVFQGLCVC